MRLREAILLQGEPLYCFIDDICLKYDCLLYFLEPLNRLDHLAVFLVFFLKLSVRHNARWCIDKSGHHFQVFWIDSLFLNIEHRHVFLAWFQGLVRLAFIQAWWLAMGMSVSLISSRPAEHRKDASTPVSELDTAWIMHDGRDTEGKWTLASMVIIVTRDYLLKTPLLLIPSFLFHISLW